LNICNFNLDGAIHKVNVFASPHNGYIIDAASGDYEPYLVGSSHESEYFKVVDSTGTMSDYRTFFFRTPEAFEHTFLQQLPLSVKKAYNDSKMEKLIPKVENIEISS